jgi:hypothetical protein
VVEQYLYEGGVVRKNRTIAECVEGVHAMVKVINGEKMEVKKVLIRSDGVKYIIIPKKSDLNAGDYVQLIKVKKEEK